MQACDRPDKVARGRNLTLYEVNSQPDKLFIAKKSMIYTLVLSRHFSSRYRLSPNPGCQDVKCTTLHIAAFIYTALFTNRACKQGPPSLLVCGCTPIIFAEPRPAGSPRSVTVLRLCMTPLAFKRNHVKIVNEIVNN